MTRSRPEDPSAELRAQIAGIIADAFGATASMGCIQRAAVEILCLVASEDTDDAKCAALEQEIARLSTRLTALRRGREGSTA